VLDDWHPSTPITHENRYSPPGPIEEINMENWTAVSFVSEVVTVEETAARQRLHTALETAVEAYMAESKRQDILGIEMFPCSDCAECSEAA
jgi:hypothetical protein